MDRIEQVKGSVIQHGPHNNRIYLMRLNTNDTRGLIATLDEMAVKNGYGKIFARIPATSWKAFKSADYIKEAVVPGFYTGKTDGFFIAKFFSASRQKSPIVDSLSGLVRGTEARAEKNSQRTDRAAREIIACQPSDAEQMSGLYQNVFKSYPFPIQDPAYLRRQMQEGVPYYCIRMGGSIAAVAATEIDQASNTAEMTDFATLPKWQGRGFAGMLLIFMDRKVRTDGIKTSYTIARADSRVMNTVFRNRGYSYAGLLKNNSQIGGSIQSMTVWYKHLSRHR